MGIVGSKWVRALLKFNRAPPCPWAQHGSVCCTQALGTDLPGLVPGFPCIYLKTSHFSLCMEPADSLLRRLSHGRAADAREVWEVPWVGAGVRPNELAGGDGCKEPRRAEPARLPAAHRLSQLLGLRGQCHWPCESSESIGVR